MIGVSEALNSYVPKLVLQRATHNPNRPTATLEQFPAAVLFADISGFTALTEQLAQSGPEGVEDLTVLLNDYFGRLIEIISAWGGDVVKFAGDALIALWYANTESLDAAVKRAADCSLHIQSQLHNYRLLEDYSLRLRIGVGAGQMAIAHVGGIYKRWELLVTGEPLPQISAAGRLAQPGEVVISASARELLDCDCDGQPLGDGFYRLDAVYNSLPLPQLTASEPQKINEMALRSYIPGAILYRLVAGQGGWLAELRRVTVIFINLPDVSFISPEKLEATQKAMQTLQTVLYRYEGSINKLSVDDKGVTLVAALGLPPLAHQDDAARGVLAAMQMQEKLRAMGWRSSIGITTGRAFCGEVGSDRRREYTMIGGVVNLAARLMTQPGARGGILCDEATWQAARQSLDFEALPPVTVKGKTEPVPVFRPVGQSVIRGKHQNTLVGRGVELTRLGERIQDLLRASPGEFSRLVVIEGEAGIGKSRLLEEMRRQAAAMGVIAYSGAGDAIEKSSPYHAWNGVFAGLFGLEDGMEGEARRVKVLQQLPIALFESAPLLNSVLGLNLPDNDLTTQMSMQVRADNTQKLLLRLIQNAAARSPRVLFLEDAHWFDSASWALLWQVCSQVNNLLVIVALRPLQDAPLEHSRLLSLPGAEVLDLEPLSGAEALTLVCHRLGVNSLPPAVATLIMERAEGHPFFSEELAYALRDAGLIQITDGECKLAPGVTDFADLNVPNNIETLITSRIDRLTPSQQLAVKTASVIGRVFAFQTLRDIYPVETARAQLADDLRVLERVDITPLETPEPDLTYLFKHIITKETAYNLLLFSQRRQLHQAVAEWYERVHFEDLAPHYAVLAHHWSKAEVTPKAVAYLELAGQRALQEGANREAVNFLRQAVEMLPDAEDAATRAKAPLLERLLGEAYFGMGQLTESRRYLESCVAGLGNPAPGGLRLGYKLARQFGRQILHRLLPGRFVGRRAADAPYLHELASAYERLSEIYFFENASLQTIHAVVKHLNTFELAGSPGALARGYASMSVAMGLVPLHGAARFYRRRARELADESGEIAARVWALEVPCVYSNGIGNWSDTHAAIERACELAEELNDRRRWEESWSILAWAVMYQGDFAVARDLYSQLTSRVADSHNAQAHVWSLLGQAECLLQLGQPDEAYKFWQAAAEPLSRNVGLAEKIWFSGIGAKVHARRGDREAALNAVRLLENLLKGVISATSYYSLYGYIARAEVWLAEWEQNPSDPQLKKEVKKALASLQKYALVLPVGRPAALLLRGHFYRVSGKLPKARKLWQKSATTARKLNMQHALKEAETNLHYYLD
jgi:class 3 adenylate cyclase/tetratricopeptide (TPR) repeat protein